MTGRPAQERSDAARLEDLADGLMIVATRALGAGDDAADAVQETLSRTLASLRSAGVPAGVPLAAFAHGVLKHIIADHYRGRVLHFAQVEVDGVPSTAASPLEQLVAAEERALMARAVAGLAPEERELLHACYVRGERVADIAQRRGVPAERIRKRKSRSLAKVRAALGLLGHNQPLRST